MPDASTTITRPPDMVFSRPLIVDSPLSASETRARMRAFATSRHMPELEAFRRRPIVGWRLSLACEDSVFRPEYGERLDVEGARFIGLVEAAGSGSRIRGRVVAAPLTKIVMSLSVLTVVFATFTAIEQGREPAGKVLGIASTIVVGAMFMARYALRSASRLVETRLRQRLDTSTRRAAA